MRTLSVIVPSGSRSEQANFLRRSIQSIAEQSLRSSMHMEVIVGLDPHVSPPELGETGVPVRFVHANLPSQAAALNAAAAVSSGDYVAFLEDDDVWHPKHILASFECLALGQFVSGTQLEVEASGRIVRINDFPTPSGWFMPRKTWEVVGEFDVAFRYHLDSEWLGRLAASGVERVHMAESTAPVSVDLARQVRPWLARVADHGGPKVRLVRQALPVPLIQRLVHDASGMQRIESDPAAFRASQEETARLTSRFGRLPW